MRIRMDDEPALGIDIAPLIDCVFLLLIFFLVATTLKRAEQEMPHVPKTEEQIRQELEEQLKVDLPEPAVAARPVFETASLRLTIDTDGLFYINSSPVGQAELHGVIRELAETEPERHLLIDVDRNAPSSYLIQVLDLCAFEGLDNYGIHTKSHLD